MNRRRTQPARPNKPEETSTSTPANASVAAFDEELAQAFFQAGQSEEALVAASERQSETELSANRTRGSARFIYGAAALGIAAAALLYLIPKGIDQAPASAASALVAPTATTTTATTTTTTTEPAPAAVAPPVPSVPVVAADNDPAATEPPSEGGGPAAPPSNAALATATNTSNTLAAAVVVPPTPEQSASETGASSATAAPIVSVRDLRARTADPAPTTDTVSSTNTTAPPPSDLMAEAAPPSAAETAKDACTKLLRRG
ncbi:MAG TPA: hypothetical protein VGG33_23355, partial [Polyangia bacterium]